MKMEARGGMRKLLKKRWLGVFGSDESLLRNTVLFDSSTTSTTWLLLLLPWFKFDLWLIIVSFQREKKRENLIGITVGFWFLHGSCLRKCFCFFWLIEEENSFFVFASLVLAYVYHANLLFQWLRPRHHTLVLWKDAVSPPIIWAKLRCFPT